MNIFHKKKICCFNNSSKAGFTLVETLVTVFIFGLIMIGTTIIFRNIFVNGRQQNLALNNIDQTRRIATIFENELRNAAYGVNGAYPIGEASDAQIVFFSTAPLKNGTVSRIRYTVTGATLSKGITNPTGSVYDLNTEKVTTLLTALSLGSNPLLYYYDGNYSGATNPLTQPININNIKFIKLTLIVLSQVNQDPTATFTVSGGAAIRNLKTNLGN